MDRRAKPKKGKAEAKRLLARTSPKVPSGNVRDLEERLAEALKLKTEALEQQAAAAEILRVISRSPTDVQPVFDSIIGAAVQLLRAKAGMLTRIVGDEIHPAAAVNQRGAEDPVVRAAFPRSAPTGTTRRPFVIALRRTSPARRPIHRSPRDGARLPTPVGTEAL